MRKLLVLFAGLFLLSGKSTRAILSSPRGRSATTVRVFFLYVCPLGLVLAQDDVDEADEDVGTVDNDLGASREASRTGT